MADLDEDVMDIVDVSNPYQPSLLQTLYGAGGRSLVVHEGYPYVAAGTDGLRLIELDARDGPRLLTGVGPTDARKLVRNGCRLYLADGAGGLKVFSIGTDGALTYEGIAVLPEAVNAVEVYEGVVWGLTDSALYAVEEVVREVP